MIPLLTLKIALIGGVAILAIAGITIGIVFAIKGDDCLNIGPPVDLKFEQKDDKVFLNWSNPENLGDCQVKYKIVLIINGGEFDPIEVDKKGYEITIPGPCSIIYAAVTTLGQNNKESERIQVQMMSDVGDVSEVDVKNLDENGYGLISWINPLGHDSCDISYNILLNGEVIEETKEEYIEISYENLDICDNKIEVTPIIQSKVGKSSEVIVKNDPPFEGRIIGKSLEVTQNNLLKAVWKKAEEYEKCEFEYRLEIIKKSNLIKLIPNWKEENYEETIDGITNCDDLTVSVVAEYKTYGEPMILDQCNDSGSF